MRLHPEVDLADPFWREQMFFSRLPAALSAVFQEDDLAECREQIEAQTAQLVPCKRARVILASRGRSGPRRKSGVARLSVPLFAHGRVLGSLALDRRERWSSPRERELVRSFAELASQALYALTVRCELFDLARTDPLTGVGNRRQLIEELLPRLGGDEFVVVLPRLSKKQARKRAKRLEEEIDRLAVSRRVRRHFHGASTGIVKARKNDSAAKVLGRGEQAMRAEKQRRRKRAEENGNGSSGRPQSRVVR